jgi:excisionase family DNA binding protein
LRLDTLESVQLLDVKTTAARLSLHPETVRDLLRSRAIVGVKTGRVWKVEEEELAAYVKRIKAAQTS